MTRLLGAGAPPPPSGRCRRVLQGEVTLQLRFRSLGGGRVAGGGRVNVWQLVLTGVIFAPVVFAGGWSGAGRVTSISGVLAGGGKLGMAPGLLAGDEVITVSLGLLAGGKVGAVSIGPSAGGNALGEAVTGGTASAPSISLAGGRVLSTASSGDGLSPPWSPPVRLGGTITSHCTSGPPKGSEPLVMAISPMARITSCFATLP